MSKSALDEMRESIAAQTELACGTEDHVTKVIQGLTINKEWFTDYEHPDRATFPLEPITRMYLYQHARGLDQSKLYRRLRGATFVYYRLGLPYPPSQQIINYGWVRRFSLDERNAIKEAAIQIRETCIENGVRCQYEPAPDPGKEPKAKICDEHLYEAVRLAAEDGFGSFTANRASNKSHELQVFLERHAYLCMVKAGTTSKARRFRRFCRRPKAPHGSTHNRTLKKLATPSDQLTLADFSTGSCAPEWKRIWGKVMPAFHAGVAKQLKVLKERGDLEIREPVKTAIDYTTIDTYPSPIKPSKEVRWDDEPVETEYGPVYVKEEFPEMVSRYKDNEKARTKQGYKFATITVIGDKTNLVVGFMPVRDLSWWEGLDTDSIERTSRADIVESLLVLLPRFITTRRILGAYPLRLPLLAIVRTRDGRSAAGPPPPE